ncbi:MAG TPA: hypothetical protein VL651_16460 [Bacteroidia bacterium]|jgi:hypothetical protein|nr:hypothetical protein [Bacteroidia bacterium]
MSHAIRFIILVICCGAGMYFFDRNYPRYDLQLVGWGLLAFFTVIYAVAGAFIRAGEKGRPGMFVQRFMATTMIRLMLFCSIILVYSFTHRDMAVTFIIHFAVFYFVFTATEVSAFYSRFSSKS